MSTLKIHFSSLSFGASVDQQTGNLSVFDVLEELRTPQLPVHLQSLVIALSIEKSEATEHQGKMLIHFLTPDGQQQLVGNGEMKIPPEQKRMKAVFRFGGFPVTQTGAHRFVVSFMNPAGNKVAEAVLDFDVSIVPQVAQGVAPADKPPMTH